MAQVNPLFVLPSAGSRIMGDLEAASRAAGKTMNCILGDKPTEVSRTVGLRLKAADLNYGDYKIQPAIRNRCSSDKNPGKRKPLPDRFHDWYKSKILISAPGPGQETSASGSSDEWLLKRSKIVEAHRID